MGSGLGATDAPKGNGGLILLAIRSADVSILRGLATTR
jgi:hypothetical protein